MNNPNPDHAATVASNNPPPPLPPPVTTMTASGGSGSSGGGGDARQVKRRKVATACDECRQRKSKCDGVKPSCGPCERKGRGPGRCTYQNNLTRTVPQSYIEELEARIRSLESSANQTQVSVGERYNSNSGEGAVLLTTASAEQPFFPTEYQRYEASPRPHLPHRGSEIYIPMIRADPAKDRASPMALPGLSPMDRNSTSNTQSGSRLYQVTTTAIAAPSPGYIHGPSSELPFPDEVRARRSSHSAAPAGGKDGADAMGTTSTGDDEVDRDENGSIFGSSSTVSFMKQIKRTVANKRTSSQSPQQVPARIPSGATEEVETTLPKKPKNNDEFLEDLEDSVLPLRSIADHLVDCYWIWVHSLYPILHRPTFMRTYQQLFEHSALNEDSIQNSLPEGKPPGRMFRCLLNLVFAFGCQFSSISSVRRDSSSDVFFKRSRLLLHVDILGSGSIFLVQALLLMGQYLQSTNYPNRCWNVVGLAIRVAQGLGLHLDSTSQNGKSIVEREVWRRVWHGCILMDRVVSMTFGHPSMISIHSQVTLPLEIDDEFIGNENTLCEQPDGRPSRMSFYISTLKLYDILGEILSIFYDSSGSRSVITASGEKTDRYYQSLLKLDRMLLDFQRELPPFLRFHSVDKNNHPYASEYPFTTRQANVLHARYLNIRILLFRPNLINLIQESQAAYPEHNLTTTLLEASLAMKCSVSCVLAAQEAIGLIDDNLLTGAVPAWWYYIFYLYIAATVLLAAKLCPALEGELDYGSLEVSWKKCIEILRGLEDRYESAKRCLATLEVFYDQIISSSNEDRQDTKKRPNEGTGDAGCESGEAFDDPLLHFNRNAIWATNVNFDWFMEHPLWNSPEVML
ncbi:fungal-specific transcription factor domain-containing protein [Trichophaea hybrida]|nr:fungal-specific transcription factor domain-containing protein [Trichophaea hybrida]